MIGWLRRLLQGPELPVLVAPPAYKPFSPLETRIIAAHMAGAATGSGRTETPDHSWRLIPSRKRLRP